MICLCLKKNWGKKYFPYKDEENRLIIKEKKTLILKILKTYKMNKIKHCVRKRGSKKKSK